MVSLHKCFIRAQGGKLEERILTSAEDSEVNLSYLHHHCITVTNLHICNSLCGVGYQGVQSSGSIPGIYWIFVTQPNVGLEMEDEDQEGVKIPNICHPLQPEHHCWLLHRDPGLWWTRPLFLHVEGSADGVVVFFSWLMNAPTKCVHASPARHWRRWCHLSARLVTSQGVYCHPEVSDLKWRSHKDKRQDVAPCTCSGERRSSGLKHINRQIHWVQWKGVRQVVQVYLTK